jgi:hypothetical protein
MEENIPRMRREFCCSGGGFTGRRILPEKRLRLLAVGYGGID